MLIGTAPLSVLSSLVAVDQSLGERSLAMVASRSIDGAPRGLPSSSTLVTACSALVSCAWGQGIVQTSVCAAFHEATMRAAITGIEDGADLLPGTVGLGSASNLAFVQTVMALEQAIVVVATTLIVALSGNALVLALQPVGRAKAAAISSALHHARRTAHTLFALEAPPEEARSAAVAFEEQVDDWESRRNDAFQRDLVAAAGRAAVAAAVFAASGGCILSSVVASLGVIASLDEIPRLAEFAELNRRSRPQARE